MRDILEQGIMIDNNTLGVIKKIVELYLPDDSYKAFVFGSRATGSSRLFSDIDLGILGPKSIPSKNYIGLTQALEDSDLPYRTDVVDFSSVSDKFKKQALTKIIEL